MQVGLTSFVDMADETGSPEPFQNPFDPGTMTCILVQWRVGAMSRSRAGPQNATTGLRCSKAGGCMIGVVRNVGAGLIASSLSLAYCFSYGALIFTGPLQPLLAQGVAA